MIYKFSVKYGHCDIIVSDKCFNNAFLAQCSSKMLINDVLLHDSMHQDKMCIIYIHLTKLLTQHLVNLDNFKFYDSFIIIVGELRYLSFQFFI